MDIYILIYQESIYIYIYIYIASLVLFRSVQYSENEIKSGLT